MSRSLNPFTIEEREYILSNYADMDTAKICFHLRANNSSRQGEDIRRMQARVIVLANENGIRKSKTCLREICKRGQRDTSIMPYGKYTDDKTIYSYGVFSDYFPIPARFNCSIKNGGCMR